MRFLALTLLAGGFAGTNWAQPGNAWSFEVASVKVSAPAHGDEIYINLGTIQHGTLTLGNASLSDCLRFAYSLSSDAQLAGPDWIKSKEYRYEIIAKAPLLNAAGGAAVETPREEMLEMLQALLKERFKLDMHREPREMSYYELRAGKNGRNSDPARTPGLAPEKDGQPEFGPRGLSYISQPHLSMLMLGTLISRFELHAPVIDRTGLPGRYSVKLEWSPANAKPDAPAGPSIFTAVEEQLGLKLEARKGPIEVLVIDKAEKVPVEN